MTTVRLRAVLARVHSVADAVQADHASRADIPPGQPILLSAASFEALARHRGRPGALDVPKVPLQVPEIAVDPGGFVAATLGGYRFSWAAYEVWLARLGPRLSWAAFPDLPCEQSLAPLEVQVRARQEQTLRWAWELWGGHDDTENWDVHRAHAWSYVVTVQGRTVGQYVRHAEQLAPLLAQQFDHYHYTAYALDLVDLFGVDNAQATRAWAQHAARHHRVGIGSLCGRNQPVEVAELVRIVAAVAEVVPWPLHLWGVKLSCLRALARAGLMPCIASFDTAAFNGAFGRDLERRRQECRTLGLTERQHALTVALPRYARKVAGVLAQQPLW